MTMGFGMNFSSMGDQFKKYMLRQQAEQQRLAMARVNGDYGLTVTAGHEHDGGRSTDAPNTVNPMQIAVEKLARADKGRTLMGAIDRLHAKRVSNGKPLVYVPD